MFLARVKGHVVATAKDPAVQGQKFLIVEPLKVDYDQPTTAGSTNKGGGRFEVLQPRVLPDGDQTALLQVGAA